MRDVFIVSAVRTPIGHFGGTLKNHSPVDLAAHVMAGAMDRSELEKDAVDLVAFGNILRAGYGQLIPRQAAIKAGIPLKTDGVGLDMVCSSGMMSLIMSAAMIKAGEADVVLTGGVESMSGTGFYLSARARWGYKFLMGNPEHLVDILLYDGLTDPTTDEPMGLQTERLIAEHGFTRQDLDEIAAESHRRAHEATESGRFADEIVPITYRARRETKEMREDEGIRPDTTLESLAQLRPAFDTDGVLTAGNSSQISDGAAAILIASGEAVERYGLEPIARYLGGAWAAGETWRFPEAPVPAVNSLLGKLDRELSDFQLFESNEAFAVNNLLFHKMLGVDYDRLNVNGGAVALGHPIGCSGSRIMVTLVHELIHRDLESGVAAICHGTGGGTAVGLERV